jgi:2-methylcitrate dehydratase PrpD
MTASREITRELAAYAALACRQPLPEHAARSARLHLLDTLAAMVSGTRLPAGLAALRYAQPLSGGSVSVPGTDLVLGANDAALVGGMMAHADETDDTHAAS